MRYQIAMLVGLAAVLIAAERARAVDAAPAQTREKETNVAKTGSAGTGSGKDKPTTGASQGSLELFVSPDGNDAWSGRIAKANAAGTDGPFATLARARDAIRQIKRDAKSLSRGGVKVWIAGGRYELAEGFELSAEDSGDEGSPIVYAACEYSRGQDAHGTRGRDARDTRDTVRLSGGRVVGGFVPVMDAAVLARLPVAARGKVVQADLRAQGIADFGRFHSRGFHRKAPAAMLEVFFQDKPMPVTCWPREGWTKIAGFPETAKQDDGHGGGIGKLEDGFFYEDDRPAAWKSFDDVWIHGYWAWDWANSHEEIDSIDVNRKFIKTKPPHGLYGFRKGQRFCFMNILEELASPGRWYLDRKTGILYFWPPAPLEQGEVVVSMAEKPLVTMTNVSHVKLQGMALECCRGVAMSITGGEGAEVRGCTIRNIGTTAVVIDGGSRHTVAGCEIRDIGDAGVVVNGGDRKTLTPCGHWVHNNHIYRVGSFSRCYCPPVLAGGVGIRISNNLIHDLPHCGILFGGNDHTIEFNEIHHVCMETGDAGAIYAGRDWTMRGNVIRHNYIHHMGGVGMGTMGVYLDDCYSSAHVYGNIFYKATRAVMIGGGCDNVVENNVFIDCVPALHVDGRGLNQAPAWRQNLQTLKERLAEANPSQPPYSQRFPELAKLTPYLSDPKGVPPFGNVIARNICSGGRWMDATWSMPPEGILDIRDNLISDEPGFVDRAGENFQLRDDSPAFKLGFQRIPMEKIGLVKEK